MLILIFWSNYLKHDFFSFNNLDFTLLSISLSLINVKYQKGWRFCFFVKQTKWSTVFIRCISISLFFFWYFFFSFLIRKATMPSKVAHFTRDFYLFWYIKAKIMDENIKSDMVHLLQHEKCTFITHYVEIVLFIYIYCYKMLR